MDTHRFHSGFADVELKVLHFHPKSPLRAWNAADELVLKHLQSAPLKPTARVLVINDSYGALAVSLCQYQPVSWGDHFTGRVALEKNLQRNQLPIDSVQFLPSVDPLTGQFDVVIIQLPKTLSLLESQLLTVRHHIHANSRVIGVGMIKHMPKTMIDLFSRTIGPTTTSLAEKKARLIFSRRDELSAAVAPPCVYDIPETPLTLVSHANVFSQQKLDIGTRFFLQHFPDVATAEQIADVGCGNGALGIYAAWQNPQASLVFLDESYLAVQSAEDSFALNNLPNKAVFMAADGFSGVDIPQKLDIVLCNPPFHEGNKIHTEIAMRMFQGAARHLTASGTLYVIGNRHLGYHESLKKYFNHVSVNVSSAKFLIVQASGPRDRDGGEN